jgi:O-antigen ligase
MIHTPVLTRTPVALLGVVGASLLVALVLARFGTTSAVAAVALPLATWWLVSRPGRGVFVAIAIVFAVPQFVSHVWLIPALATTAGLLAGTARMRIRGIDVIVALLLLWLLLSWQLFPNTGVDLKTFLTLTVPIYLYATVRLATGRDLIRPALWVILIAGTVGALSVLFDWATGTVHFADPTAYQWADPKELFRAGGIFGGSPAAAICLSMAMLATAPLWTGSRQKIVRVCVGLMLWAIVVTFARAGWIGLIGGLILLVMLLPVQARRVAVVLGLAGVVLLGCALWWSAAGPSATSGIVASPLYQKGLVRSENTRGREEFLALAAPMLVDTPTHFLVGRGFDAFQAKDGTLDAGMAAREILINRGGPHNEYFRAWLEQGVVGLILVLGWLLGLVLVGARASQRLEKRSSSRLTIAGLTASVVAFTLAGLFHDLSHNAVSLGTLAIVSALLVSAVDHPERFPVVSVGNDDGPKSMSLSPRSAQ